VAYALNLGPGIKKLDARSQSGLFVGYEADGSLFRVLLDDGHTVIVTKHVKSCEDSSNQHPQLQTELDDLMTTAVPAPKAPKQSARFATEVMEYQLDEESLLSPGVSQPLCPDSGSVPALPVVQSLSMCLAHLKLSKVICQMCL
jgi:hypothetical protein